MAEAQAQAQAQAHEDHDSPEYLKKQVKVYLAIGGCLLVLTWFTVYVSSWELSPAAGIYLALAIATVKASLVAAYFMHLIDEKKIIYATLILTVFMFGMMMFGPSATTHTGVGGASAIAGTPTPLHKAH